MNDLRKTQASFARKAQAQPTHRFGDLYHLICREDWLQEALGRVLRNTGSRTADIDGISRKQLQNQAAQTAFIPIVDGTKSGYKRSQNRAKCIKRTQKV